MDFVKDIANKAKQGGSGGSSGQQQQGGQGGDQNMDYVDKAWDQASKKAGHDFDRQTDEKITDGARGAFEKATGKHVPDKVSN